MTIISRIVLDTSLLNTSETFTSEWIDVESYSDSLITILTDVTSDTSGVICQHSTDTITIDEALYNTITLPGGNIEVEHSYKYFRIIYTNGNSNQTRFKIRITHIDNTIVVNDEPIADPPISKIDTIMNNTTDIGSINNELYTHNRKITNMNTGISSINSRVSTLENKTGGGGGGTYDDTEIVTLVNNNTTNTTDISNSIAYYNYHLEMFAWGWCSFDGAYILENNKTITPEGGRVKRVLGGGTHAWEYSVENNKGYWRMKDSTKEGLWKIHCKVSIWKSDNGEKCILMYLNKGLSVEVDLNLNTSTGDVNYQDFDIDGQNVLNAQLVYHRSVGFNNPTFYRITRIAYDDPISIIINFSKDLTDPDQDGYHGHLLFEYLGPDFNDFDTSETTF